MGVRGNGSKGAWVRGDMGRRMHGRERRCMGGRMHGRWRYGREGGCMGWGRCKEEGGCRGTELVHGRGNRYQEGRVQLGPVVPLLVEF